MACGNGFVELAHEAIDGGQEQFTLGGEIAVNGALAYAEAIGQGLGVGLGVSAFGEKCGGGFEDLFFTASFEIAGAVFFDF